jgi:hypothetical protein
LDRAGQLKGADFLQFYTAGALARHGPTAASYDRAAFADFSTRLLPESRGMRYLPVYGPQLSLLFEPFALLPYAWALSAWLLITAAMYSICVRAVWKRCPNIQAEPSTVVILAAAYPAFFNLMAHGQNSAIALACFTAFFLALLNRKPFVAGLAIGTLIYKPPLGLVAACVFTLSLEWKMVAGALISAGAQLSAAWLHYGTGVMIAYWHALLELDDINPLLESKPYQMHSLLSFWKLLMPWPDIAVGLYAISAAVTILIAWRVWRARANLSLRFSFLLLATVLVSPHLYVYDLVILAPALILSADWALGHPLDRLATPILRTVYFSYGLPLAGVAAQLTGVQLSVVAISALSAIIAIIVRRHSSDSPASGDGRTLSQLSCSPSA